MVFLAKVILAGDGAVGKTALRRTFMGQNFNGEYQLTIGADFSIKELFINDEKDNEQKNIKFQIWDLAGQPRFQEVRSLYYSGVLGALLVYDITRPNSFDHIPNWLLEIKKYSRRDPVPVILLANKVDLKDEAEFIIDTSEGQSLSEKIAKVYFGEENAQEIPYFETSAKTGENVDTAFYKLGEIILKNEEN